MKNRVMYLLTILGVFLYSPMYAATDDSEVDDDWLVQFVDAQITMTVGESVTPKVTIEPCAPAEYRLEWKSLNPAVATVSDSGEVTAVGPGRTTIEVKPEGQSLLTHGSSLTVIVHDNDIDHIRLILDGDLESEGWDLIPARVSQIYRIKAWLNGDDITSKAKWSSSNEEVASVTQEGVVTIEGIGEAVVSASYNSNGTEYTSSEKFVCLQTFDPVLKPITDKNDSGFTISWEPVDGASFYTVEAEYFDKQEGDYKFYESIKTEETSARVTVNPELSSQYRCVVSSIYGTAWGGVAQGSSEPVTVEIDPSGVEGIEAEQPSAAGIDYAKPYEVYTLDGRLAGNSLAPLAKGIYILRQNGAAVKVAKRD